MAIGREFFPMAADRDTPSAEKQLRAEELTAGRDVNFFRR